MDKITQSLEAGKLAESETVPTSPQEDDSAASLLIKAWSWIDTSSTGLPNWSFWAYDPALGTDRWYRASTLPLEAIERFISSLERVKEEIISARSAGAPGV